jgi:pyruvate,water dikinase
VGDYAKKLESVGHDTDRVGQKARRIGGMLAAGLPVPSGFVLTTEAYIKFLRHNRIANKISGLVEESHSAGFQKLREISGQIQNLIVNGIMPDFIEREVKDEYQDLSIGREAKEIGGAALDLIRAGRDNVFVTVRPSPSSGGIASANFSGQMKSVISRRGNSQITDSIKEVWASLFSPRAMLYRKRKRIRDMPAMGVIVQKSLEPEKSGFAYTCVPETGDDSSVVIEGSWGFSESILSGSVSPDEYVISKESGDIRDKTIRKKTWMSRRDEMTGRIVRQPVFRERVEADLLDAKEIRKIFELSARVEKHFGSHPQEIEWCEERGRIFLVDSCPVPDYGMRQEPGDSREGLKHLAKGTVCFRGEARGKARLFTSLGDLDRIERGDILVTRMTIPEMLPVIPEVSGIVTDEGSRSCHAAVLCREFGVPCIVLAGNATSVVKDGQDIEMIASEGRLYPVRDEPDGVRAFRPPGNALYSPHEIIPQVPLQAPGAEQIPYNTPGDSGMPEQIPGGKIPPAQIPGGLGDEGITATGIRTMISVPGSIGNSPDISDGVGIIRAEHMITETGKHPFSTMRKNPEEIILSLMKGLGTIARAFHPKPVWYRSVDIRTDEFRELDGGAEEPSENNPLMGWHGIRRSMDDPGLLRIEIEVIKKLYREGLNNIFLGIPFISSIEELRAVKQMAGPSIKVGIMLETPASGLEIEGFCREGIAFAAIGLNDLTQLVLGVDRENSRISKLYSELSPAVTNLLKHILGTCRKYSVETSVYGDFASDPRIAEHLVTLGVGSISTEPENLEEVRGIISRTERKLILDNMRNRS